MMTDNTINILPITNKHKWERIHDTYKVDSNQEFIHRVFHNDITAHYVMRILVNHTFGVEGISLIWNGDVFGLKKELNPFDLTNHTYK